MEYLKPLALGGIASYAAYCPILDVMYSETTSNAWLNSGANYNFLVGSGAAGTIYPWMFAATVLTGFSVGMAASYLGAL